MKYSEWEELKQNNYDAYKSAYLDFMYNPQNCGNCSECPERQGEHKNCGQQNCWVYAHCKMQYRRHN